MLIQNPKRRRSIVAALAERRLDFDVTIAEDTSRLFHNLAEQSPRLAELCDLGVHVVTHDLDTRHESARCAPVMTAGRPSLMPNTSKANIS